MRPRDIPERRQSDEKPARHLALKSKSGGYCTAIIRGPNFPWLSTEVVKVEDRK